MIRRHAMSLIDLMITLSIMTILVSFLIPAISIIRDRSYEAKSLANMRTHTQVLSLYTSDHHDTHPYLADPNATLNVIRGGGRAVSVEFFWVSDFWFLALTDTYYDSSLDYALFAYPEPGNGAPYLYSATLYTRPEFWSTETRTGPEQWRPTRVHEVTYPSSKASFTEFKTDGTQFPGYNQHGVKPGRYGFGFLDASSRRIDANRINSQVLDGDGGGPHTRFNFGVIGLHTIDGVRGRDVD